MSLTVSPYIRNKDLEIVYSDVLVKPPFNDLFGIESWRIRVWGAKTVEELGCTILPSLKRADIFAEGKELEELETELFQIKKELKYISDKLKIDEKSIEFRIRNALEAIRIAKKHPTGGVNIG